MEVELREERRKNQRLLTEFEKKWLEMVRSIKNLIGYKVKFNENKTIRLTSLVNPEINLIFRVIKKLFS
jgi:hypothetical protein